MNCVIDEMLFKDENEACSLLFQSLINGQKNLIVLMHKNRPLLFNRSFGDFFDCASIKKFTDNYGALHNCFVPYDAYFHAAKADVPENWAEALMALPEQDRIVSMVNHRADPHAFAVAVESPVTDYAVVTFTDISQDLIKRVMIENDASIDKASGAYDREYFIHTSKSFNDAAAFNDKAVGITMVELISSDADNYIRDFASSIAGSIRQSDMLVSWGRHLFLLAYLVDTPENAMKFSQKLLCVMKQEPLGKIGNISMRLGTTVQRGQEEIDQIIKRAETALQRSEELQITLL